ncbi:rRNA adenine N-6-methyltransferase family protein [Embleya hyalina]|uniref:rRNA adenine N-6-methyltransferase family protein n=1 Tax=Embleya hyalina TaxID=516124 RepID=UPI000F83AFF7
MPRTVASMLDHLRARKGQRVLEIGTGVGITAALLATRLGDHAVTSIETRPDRGRRRPRRAAPRGAPSAPARRRRRPRLRRTRPLRPDVVVCVCRWLLYPG